MFELRPILSALWRHKTSALLIVLQIALTLAIVSNAAVIVQQRLEKIARPTGMAVEDIVTVSFQPIAQGYDMADATRRDLELIRSLPGVISASQSNYIPLSGSGSSAGLHSKSNQQVGAVVGAYYSGDEHLVDTLGLTLTAGRNFRPGDIGVTNLNSNWRPEVAMVTQQFADAMYPDGDALGKYLYVPGEEQPIEIIGIVERHLGPHVNSSRAGKVVFFPALLERSIQFYLIRAAPGQRDAVLKQVEEKLARRDPRRVIDMDTLEDIKRHSYAGDHLMVKVLGGVAGLLTFIVALGIVGLTVFWITQRQKQIGVRRALGATRSAISRYFLLENGMIAGAGILTGCAAAQIFNHLLVSSFNQPVLPLPTTLVCALILLGISLAAALAPALRAANISPATATRSV